MSSTVLVLSNDSSMEAARTSRHLCRALERLGRTAVGRDTRIVRWAAARAELENPERCAAYETAVVAKWHKFMFDYGFDTVLSVDLNWLFTAKLFVPSELVRSIHSFWRSDPCSTLEGASMFPPAPHTQMELIKNPKVTHHVIGAEQRDELVLLGVQQVRQSAAAAPAEYVEASQPCTEWKRVAFIGDPGLTMQPRGAVLQALRDGHELDVLRRLSLQEIMDDLAHARPACDWIQECPPVEELLAAALELRLTRLNGSAISLVGEAGESRAEASSFLRRKELIPVAARLIKRVNRYDRLALVLRLHRRGWIDVYGAADQWAPYGIAARPPPTFPQLAEIYWRYAVHLNFADGMADERIFEIAARGRASLNFGNLEACTHYSEDEVVLAKSGEELETAAADLLARPDRALAMGEAARTRTARDHLWEHRLEKALS